MMPVADGRVRLSYWIDSNETVVKIVGPWDAWLGHDGEVPEHGRKHKVVGNSLFSFIVGDGVRHVYRTMHARILETGRTIEFPFRCDSAWFRRDMQMRIGREGNSLRYDSVLISETRRPRPLPRPAPAADTLVAMCSFCKVYRFPIESPLWKDIESLFVEPNLPELFSITHSLCEHCAALWLREL